MREYNYKSVISVFQLVIFGGMNDQKDFNDVCILQTRAALKHLPAEMTGMVWFTLAVLLLLCHASYVLYQTQKTVFDQISEHREKSSKCDAQRNIFDDPRGIWKCGQTLS